VRCKHACAPMGVCAGERVGRRRRVLHRRAYAPRMRARGTRLHPGETLPGAGCEDAGAKDAGAKDAGGQETAADLNLKCFVYFF